jgi:acyl-CoA synthetase (AMP-forming)/AMP-acid ligase II
VQPGGIVLGSVCAAPKKRREGILTRLLAPDRRCALHFLQEKQPTDVRETLSLGALAKATRQTAALLLDRGVQPGERVVLCIPTSPDFAAWFLGAMWAGAVPVPLPPINHFKSKPALFERLEGALESCRPRVLVADGGTLPLLQKYGEKLLLLRSEERGDEDKCPEPVTDEETDLAFLQYTGGSTGNPKGVVVTRANLRANVQAIGEAVEVSPKDRMISWMPLFHDMGLVGTFLFCLYWKLPLFLYSQVGFVQKPTGWLRAISKHRATIALGPHFAFALCARKLPERDFKTLDLSSWRLALDGSEPVRPSSMRLFMERFAKYGFPATAYHPVYGMSEATLAICMPTPSEGPRVDRIDREMLTRHGVAVPTHGEAGAAEFVSVGVPLPGHRVEIRDLQTGALCPDRRVGQICFSGPSVTARYFRMNAAGQDEGMQDPPRQHLETGDMGYLADGRLFVVDRAKDIIIHAGANFYPSDLERTVEGVPGIRRSRVVAFGAHSHDTGTEGVVIAAEISSRLNARQIADEVRHRVASAFGLTLEDLVLLPPKSLPYTLNGKPQRSRAQREYLAGRLAQQVRLLK